VSYRKKEEVPEIVFQFYCPVVLFQVIKNFFYAFLQKIYILNLYCSRIQAKLLFRFSASFQTLHVYDAKFPSILKNLKSSFKFKLKYFILKITNFYDAVSRHFQGLTGVHFFSL